MSVSDNETDEIDENSKKKTIQKRTTYRALTTKLLNKIESCYKDENLDDENKNEELKTLYDQLIEKEYELVKLNIKIEAFISVDEIEREIISVDEYSEKILKWKSKVKRKIDKINEETQSVSSHENLPLSSLNRTPMIEHKKLISLPKLTLPKYFGDPCLWLEFWAQFEDAVHKNTELSNVEKFHYLKNSLGGLALNSIKGFCLTDSNYDKCIKLISDRFGREDLVINGHMTKLLNLEPVKNSSNLRAFRNLYDQLEINIRSLESLKVASGSYGQLLCPIILKLLPPDVSLGYNKIKESKGQFNVNELMKFIKIELESRESSLQLTQPKIDYSPPYHRSANESYAKRNNPHTSALTTIIKDKKCIFCFKGHDSLNCRLLSLFEKRAKLKREGRCFKCLCKGHLSVECQENVRCKKCVAQKEKKNDFT
nr:uncharacterized protein LOC110282014 [Parasteatoda tepidariorum]